MLLAGCAAPSSSSLPGGLGAQPLRSMASPIQHVVLIVQENRSFDDFFARFPGADGASRGKMKVKRGGKYVDRWVKLEPHALVMPTDIEHCHSAFETDYDDKKMDGFNLQHFGVCRANNKPVGTAVYQYVEEQQIAPYWAMAQQYVLADAMFQTQGSGSYTAHQDLIRGATSIDANKSGGGYTESLIDTPMGSPGLRRAQDDEDGPHYDLGAIQNGWSVSVHVGLPIIGQQLFDAARPSRCGGRLLEILLPLLRRDE